MRAIVKLVLLILILAPASLSYAQYETKSCANLYGGPWTFLAPNQIDYTEHAYYNGKPQGSHFIWGQFSGSCTYSGDYKNGPNGLCNSACSTTTSTLVGESGPPFTNTIAFYQHAPAAKGTGNGYAQADGGGSTCGGGYGGAVEWCIANIGCGLNITVNASTSGLGVGVSISPRSCSSCTNRGAPAKL